MMGLRKYINGLEFSKKVNYSPRGRRFENSDFARSVEITGMCIKDTFQKKEFSYKLIALGMILVLPITYSTMRKTIKDAKKEENFSYYEFVSSSDLILNH